MYVFGFFIVKYFDGNLRLPLGFIITILIDTFASLFIQCYKKSAISHKTLHHGDIFSWSL